MRLIQSVRGHKTRNLPLPSSISLGSIQSHTLVFNSSCPASLPGLDRKATGELIRTLIETLNRDFSANINPNIVLANNWAGKSDIVGPPESLSDDKSDTHRHIVLLGASNMKRLVPLLTELGYNVTDLSEPSWLATPANIEHAVTMINTLSLEPGYSIVVEPCGNSMFHFRQFDGTLALPFKCEGGYHMGGPICTCDDESFLRTFNSIGDILDSEGAGVKIIIPTLPRHLFKGCCENNTHSTNLNSEN
jgi:hypothetical protein